MTLLHAAGLNAALTVIALLALGAFIWWAAHQPRDDDDRISGDW